MPNLYPFKTGDLVSIKHVGLASGDAHRFRGQTFVLGPSIIMAYIDEYGGAWHLKNHPAPEIATGVWQSEILPISGISYLEKLIYDIE